MEKIILILTVAVSVGVSLACSVQHKTVDTRPPIITDPVLTLAFEEGQMKLESMSAIMNDPSWSEADAEAQMRVIGKASGDYERGSLMLGGMQVESKKQHAVFAAMKCVETFGPVGKTSTDYKESDKVEWREGIDTSSPAYAACEKNQQTRLAIWQKLPVLMKNLEDTYGAIVKAAGVENIKQMADKEHSMIKIETTRAGVAQVAMAIGNFASSGKVQTLGDGITRADWERARRTLRFHLAAKSARGETAEYRFSLHRAQDLAQDPTGSCAVLAKFSGEVKLVRLPDEQVLQTGSGQVTGWMVPNTGCPQAARF